MRDTWQYIGLLNTLLIFLVLLSNVTIAQVSSGESIKVSKNNKIYLNPWAGGLNNPQFSEADLNFDGINELIVFDRSANTILVFEYKKETYIFSRELSTIFPKMINFCLVRDYDNDGIPDLFTFSYPDPASGIRVYKGTINEKGGLEFIGLDHNEGKFPNVLHYQGSNNKVNIYCAITDIPVIDDIDGDGDLDILAFEPSGGRIWYYRNMSVERGFGADSLHFVREDVCWGKILEGPSFDDIILSPDPNTCAKHLDPLVEIRHAGSNILTIDQNNNGLKDLIITDIDVTEVKLLINSGTSENSWLSESIDKYPPQHPVDINIFPASFHVDINRDGLKDLIFSPGSSNFYSESIETAWYYENVGPFEDQQFEWRQSNFLSDEMLDFGSGTIPAIADVTGNGLLDIVVGVHSKLLNGNHDNLIGSVLVLLENVGSKENPEFIVQDEDWLGLSSLGPGVLGLAPTFGDIDGDGDLDLMLGTLDGTLIFLENLAGKGRRMRFNNPITEAFGIDVGRNAVPSFGDINNDGLLDLIIGENLGSITYYKNLGTSEVPMFSPTLDEGDNIPFFAGIDVRENPVPGSAAPYYFVSNGKSYICSGRTDSGILLYENAGNFDDYRTVGVMPNTVHVGRKTGLALADLNNNGFHEMVVGNIRGGLNVVSTNLVADENASVEPEFEDTFLIYPVPSSGLVNILYLNAKPEDKFSLKLYNISGIVVKIVRDVPLFEQFVFNIKTLPAGVYFLRIEGDNKSMLEKLVKIQ